MSFKSNTLSKPTIKLTGASTPSKTVKSENDLSSATNSASPFNINRQEILSPSSPYMSKSARKGEASGKLKESRQAVDAFKQSYASTESKNEQLQSLMTLVREKLGVSPGVFQIVKDGMIERIEELLRYRGLYDVEKGEKERVMDELRKEKEEKEKVMGELKEEKEKGEKALGELNGEKEKYKELCETEKGEKEKVMGELKDEREKGEKEISKWKGLYDVEKAEKEKVMDELSKEKEEKERVVGELKQEKERVMDDLKREKEEKEKVMDELKKEKEKIMGELKEEKEKKEKALGELDEEKENMRKCMEVFNKGTEDIIEEAKGFLENNIFVFKKKAILAIMKGAKIKERDMASVEKVHLDYKGKKVIVEYSIEEKDLNRQERDIDEENKVFEDWNNNAKALLKAVRRLGKKFVKINYFMLYNITDFYRFIKEKDSKNPGLTKIFSELEAKEKELRRLNTEYDEREVSGTKELWALGFMGKMRGYLNETSIWWDQSFKTMKEVYQDLSNNTMYLINDMQDKLQLKLEKSSPR